MTLAAAAASMSASVVAGPLPDDEAEYVLVSGHTFDERQRLEPRLPVRRHAGEARFEHVLPGIDAFSVSGESSATSLP